LGGVYEAGSAGDEANQGGDEFGSRKEKREQRGIRPQRENKAQQKSPHCSDSGQVGIAFCSGFSGPGQGGGSGQRAR